MGPLEVIQCEQCGRGATVRSSTPVFDRSETAPEAAPSVNRASVVLDCPQCGMCTQIVELDGS